MCHLSEKKKSKVRHLKMPTSISGNPDIFLSRYQDTENEQEICPFYVTLDHISSQNSVLDTKCIMICDVRDHVTKRLPDEVTGFWVRFFGPKNKFTFQVSLWQSTESKRKGKLQKDSLMKVNELRFDIHNDGVIIRKPVKRVNFALNSSFVRKEFKGSHFVPTFCDTSIYVDTVSSLRGCLEEGKFSEFLELYENYKRTLLKNSQQSIEFELLLSIEKSWYFAVKGECLKAKKLLQEVVGSIIPRTPNKTFLLNRAYSILANVHLIEGNVGTAEDCINMLQIDKRNGIPFEERGYFYSLHAEMMMNFSKKLPELREKLQEESLLSFTKAEASFAEAAVPPLQKVYWVNLCRARLFICEHYDTCCSSNIEQANHFKNKVLEQIDHLSLRTKSYLMFIQSECHFYEGEFDDAEEKLKEFRESIGTFPEFRIVYNRIKKQRDIIKAKKNPSASNNSLETSHSDIDYYDADESS